ncbi:MAG: hypothetical protein IKH37_07700 [Prevotella sp.]|nr:hypothetical protein [Prevotella sp.]
MINKLKYLMLAAVAVCLFQAENVSAKGVLSPKMYVFGVAASFNDTIVHITDIQTLDSAWVSSKSKFLLGRESYSYQLRDYIAETLHMPHRTCITLFATKRSKIEKEYLKMMRLYGQTAKTGKKKKQAHSFEIRHINQNQFRYKSVDMGDYDEQQSAKQTRKQKKRRKN